MKRISLVFVALLVSGLCSLPGAGCSRSGRSSPVASFSGESEPAPVFLSVVSDMNSNPQAVDMAMKLAGFAVDEGREVFMFFNVKGVRVASNLLDASTSFGTEPPVRDQLNRLIERGVIMHACPVCMKAHELGPSDIIKGISVTTRNELFSRITPGVAIFTY